LKRRTEENRKALRWVNANKPGKIYELAASSRKRQAGSSKRAQLQTAKGQWSGAGSLYRLDIEIVKEKIDSREARAMQIILGNTKGVSLSGNRIKASLVEATERNASSKDEKKRSERMQIRLGKDVLVFTRF
jgi:hypothetical protein